MKINCIIKNTKILNKLEVLVKNISDTIIQKDVVPTPSNIYNQIRNLGVEVDLSTIGAIYAKNLSGTDATFLSIKEVGKEVGADFNNTIKKIIQLDKGTKEIGKRSPAEAVANAFANIFVDRNAPPQVKTLMRQMQDIMLKGLKRHLPSDNATKNSLSPLEVATEALKKMSALGITDIKGQINNLEDVFNDIQIELAKQVKELKEKGANAATIAKYKEMIDNVRNSTYQLLLSKTEAKNVIIEAIKKYNNGVYTKTDKEGNVKLDYDALSGHVKSEQDLIENVEKALEGEGFSKTEIDIITNSLAQEFKDAYANILQKAVNKLNAKRDAKDRMVVSKSDLERLAQLHALGAFGSTHEKMIYELLGLNEDSSIGIAQVEQIAAELNRMRDLGFVEGNENERELNSMIDHIIAEARYKDAGWFYKTTRVISDIFGMANLAILNNIKNRIENNTSGRLENLNSVVQRGGLPTEINKLATARKNNIIQNGGLSAGEMSIIFQGDNSATERVRKKITGWLSEGNTISSNEKVGNWFYNQIMGTAALNGVDSYNKTKQVWSRFINNMEQLLLDKGLANNKKQAQQILHQQLFGDAWLKAEEKAKALTDTIQKEGSVLKNATPEKIKLLAADIVKAELINNKLITQEELDATWNASYRAAGRAMGHVSNNYFSTALQYLNNLTQQEIQKKLDKGEYNKAAWLVFGDLFLSKVIFKFAGGGTNWIVLNVEKAGAGLVLGVGKKLNMGKMKNLSEMTPKEIEKEIYTYNVQNDKITRGGVGMAVNAGLLLIAYSLYGGDDDEDKRRRAALLKWVENNRWANKYLNILPVYVSGYLAVMKQKESKDGLAGTVNKYQYSPLRNWVENFTNRSDTYSFDNQIMKGLGGIAGKKEGTQEKGWETIGQMMGGYFNVNPLPYRPIKDTKVMFDGIMGKSASDKKITDDGKVNVLSSMFKGYLKYGITDWSLPASGKVETFTQEQMNNPDLKIFIDKKAKLPVYIPAKIQTKEVNGKVTEHLSDYDLETQKAYVDKANEYLNEELKKLSEGKIKIYQDKNGTATTPTKEEDQEGKKRIKFEDLTPEQLQNVISGSGGITTDITKKVKKEILTGKTVIEK